MLKLSAIESLIGRQCCTEPRGLYKALRAVQSLTGCTKPHGQYEALRLNRRPNRPANL
jgi:hypothetical protein